MRKNAITTQVEEKRVGRRRDGWKERGSASTVNYDEHKTHVILHRHYVNRLTYIIIPAFAKNNRKPAFAAIDRARIAVFPKIHRREYIPGFSLRSLTHILVPVATHGFSQSICRSEIERR